MVPHDWNLSDAEVLVFITGQLRQPERLLDFLGQRLASDRASGVEWCISTWHNELTAHEPLCNFVQAHRIPVILSDPPVNWVSGSAIPQHVSLRNAVRMATPDQLVLRTRSDIVSLSGVGHFLEPAVRRAVEIGDRLAVESISLNAPFFAQDFQFMARGERMQELSNLDAVDMTSPGYRHAEQRFFAPAKRPLACEYWDALDGGTIFGHSAVNAAWARFRVRSVLYSACLAQYFRYALEHWTVARAVTTPVSSHRTWRLEDILFSETGGDVQFFEDTWLTLTSNMSIITLDGLRSLTPSDFGDRVAHFMHEAPSASELAYWLLEDLRKLEEEPLLRGLARLLISVDEESKTVTLASHTADAVRERADRLRQLEVENSALRETLRRLSVS